MTSRVCGMGGYPPVVYKFCKEAFDEIALFVEPEQEAGRSFVICFWQDGQPPCQSRRPLHATSQHHRLGPREHLTLMDVSQNFGCSLNVMVLAGRDDKLHRQTNIIGQSIDFCSKTSPTFSKSAIRAAFLKSLPNDGRVRLYY